MILSERLGLRMRKLRDEKLFERKNFVRLVSSLDQSFSRASKARISANITESDVKPLPSGEEMSVISHTKIIQIARSEVQKLPGSRITKVEPTPISLSQETKPP